nr:hypothetical protein [Tanacetum cinerariifolium]
SIKGEPLSPDRVFDFFVDEPESYPAYDFFAPRPLRGYAGNPNNNNNGWIEADVPFFRELEAVADEHIAGPLDDEIAEPIVKAEEQVITPLNDMDEDIAMLFGDDNFEDDDSKEFDEEEVWEVGGPSTVDAAEGQSFPLPASGLFVPSSMIEDLSNRVGNLKYGNGQLVKKVIQLSDVEVVDGISIRKIIPRVSAIEGQVQVMVSQMVQTDDELEHIGAHVEQGLQTAAQRDEVIAGLTQQVHALQAAVQQRDLQIQQLHTMVSKMSSRESTLMQCILGMDM